jgi:CHAD domain-containing protein
MAFELKPAEPLRKAVRRIARKQMKSALNTLAQADADQRDQAVHEARKSFKKVRAVLRLVRPKISPKRYRAENTCFRDAGRPLTEVRDAKILVETLDKLIEHDRQHVSGHSFGAIRQALTDNLDAVRRRVLDEEQACARVGDAVRQARKRVKRWADVPNRWASIGAGLTIVYRRAGAACEAATADLSVDKLHEWRKQTKYLLYQLEILRPICTERMQELVDAADRMGELLGDDHDLAVLRQFLTDASGRFGDEAGMLVGLIDRRRAELEEEAVSRGRLFFQDGPEGFAARLKGYWKSWRARARKRGSRESAPLGSDSNARRVAARREDQIAPPNDSASQDARRPVHADSQKNGDGARDR